MENIDLLSNDLQVSPQVLSYLTESAKWGKFLAIMGFILCGIMVLVSFLIPAIITNIPPYNNMASQLGSGMKVGLTVLYLCFSVLFFFPACNFFTHYYGCLYNFLPVNALINAIINVGKIDSLYLSNLLKF